MRIFLTLLLTVCFGHAASPVVRVTRTVSTIADLVALTPSTVNPDVHVQGYYEPGDGGENSFIYVAASTATTNRGYCLPTTTGTGRWISTRTFPLNVRQFGAKGDGFTDDMAAIQNALDTADAGGSVLIPIGQFRAANLTIEKPLTVYGEVPSRRQLTDTTTGGNLTNNFTGSEIVANAAGWVFIVQRGANTNHWDEENMLLPVNFRDLTIKGAERTIDAGGLWIDRADNGLVENVSFQELQRSSIYLNRSVREWRFYGIRTRYCGDRVDGYPDLSIVDQETSSDSQWDRHNFLRFDSCDWVFPLGNAIEVGTVQMTTNGRVVNRIDFSNCMIHGSTSTNNGGFLEMTNTTRQAFRLVKMDSCTLVNFKECNLNWGGVASPMMEFTTRSMTNVYVAGFDSPTYIRVANCTFSETMLGDNTDTCGIYAHVGSGLFAGNIFWNKEDDIDMDPTVFNSIGQYGPLTVAANTLLEVFTIKRGSLEIGYNSASVYSIGGVPVLRVGPNYGGRAMIANSIIPGEDKVFDLAGQSYTSQSIGVTAIGQTNTTSANITTIGGGYAGSYASTEVGIYAAADTTTLSGTRILSVTTGGVQLLVCPEYADNAAALSGGLVAGEVYRTGDTLKIVH